jgi:hypothetical protein
VVAGDFNHDGKVDFGYGALNNGQPFSLYFGNGDGTFGTPVPIGATGSSVPTLAVAADLNNDGYTDIVYLDVSEFSNQIRKLLSAADGSYTDTAVGGLPSPTLGFVVGDFNNDHVPDIFAINGNDVGYGLGRAYLGACNGAFVATGTPVVASDGYLASPPFVAGDFDHDGNIDIATRTVHRFLPRL